MDSKTIVAIIAVACIVVAAAAALMLLNDNGDNHKDDVVSPTGRLVVYGNANNDDFLDKKDVDYINDIISGKISWNQKNNKYADANLDGKIDGKDVEIVQKIINRESVEISYDELHFARADHPRSNAVVTNTIKYPVKCDTIAVGYYEVGYLMTILGLWDKVKYVDENTSGHYMDYPSEGLPIIGNFKTIDADAIHNSGVDVFIGYGTYQKQARDDLKAMHSPTQVIEIQGQGIDCLSEVVTMGFLLNANDNARKWIDFYDKTMDKIQGAVKDILPQNYNSYYVLKGENNANATNLTIHAQGSDRSYPDLQWILELPAQNFGKGDTYQISNLDVEYFVNHPSDYLIWSFTGNQARDCPAAMQTFPEFLKGTQAYENGNIIGFAYTMFNSYYGVGMLLYLAGMLYPGQIDMNDAYQTLVDYYNQFHYYGYSEDNKNFLVYKWNPKA